MITIKNQQRRFEVDKQRLVHIVAHVLDALNYADFDIGILVTTNKTIRIYNARYRNKDKATDILSFSYHTDLKPGKRIRVTSEEDKNLGDLILSFEYIHTSAQELNVSFMDRLKLLLVHGILHLLGYDHETDQQFRTMQKKESSIVKTLAAL